MRIALSIAAALGVLATLLCAGVYFFFAPAQAGETRAELSVFLNRPVPADVPEMHSRRLLQQGRNTGIVGLFTGASAGLILIALALSRRKIT